MTTDHDLAAWRRLDLTTVPVVEPYRAETAVWAAKIKWAEVCVLALDLLDRGMFTNLTAVTTAAQQLGNDDAMALSLLYAEPITASPEQITNGVHRIAAMRAQGVRWTVQYY